MNRKEQLVKDLKYLGLIAVVMFVFFKFHYKSESIFILIKLLIAHFYLFILPGYAIMLSFIEKLDFWERFAIALGVGYGVQPLLLYLINTIVKVNILKYNQIVSIALIVIGLLLFFKKKKS